jgi:integral membrane protein
MPPVSAVAAFRTAALVEAATYVCLLAAVVAKRVFDHPEWVPVVGPIHGLAFLAYFLVVVVGRDDLGWGRREVAAALLAAVVPLGALVAERRLPAAA